MQLSRIIRAGGLVSLSGLVLAGCSLPFMGAKTPSDQPQNAVDQMANAAQLSVMMSTGQSGTCFITDTSSEAQDAMEISIKGKKFLIKGTNFSVDSSDPTQQKTKGIGYMLNDTEYTYIWEEAATTGMKIKAAEPASTESPEVAAANQDLGPAPRTSDQDPLSKFEADPKYRIDCQLANIADETLMPPTSVQFMDLSQGTMNPAMMQQQSLPQTTNETGQ